MEGPLSTNFRAERWGLHLAVHKPLGNRGSSPFSGRFIGDNSPPQRNDFLPVPRIILPGAPHHQESVSMTR